MRIAQIAPIVERTPPKKYGGTERVVYNLTEELVKRGHQVTLFASGDSITSANLQSVYPKALKEAEFEDLYGNNIYTLLNIGQAYSMQDQFDIIHDHNGYFSLPSANICRTPVVMTYHGPITADVKYVHEMLRNPYLISISKAQTRAALNLNWLSTVYNGLEMDHYPFGDNPENYLLFVGRITEEKGVHYAIEVANQLGMKLIIAAKLEMACKPDVQYYEEKVKPFLSDQVQWIGEVEERQRNELMSKALCFLHPITWPEPFGLTLIESLACGTPVVAFGLGSIPEIIKNGETGYVVNSIPEMIEAIKKVAAGEIDRQVCSDYARSEFSAKKMADGYEAAYLKAIEQNAHRKNNQILKQRSFAYADNQQYPFKQFYAHQISGKSSNIRKKAAKR